MFPWSKPLATSARARTQLWLRVMSCAVGGVLILDTAALRGASADGQQKPPPFSQGKFTLRRGEVVAFLGGADVSAAQQNGHLESLLAVAYQGKLIHCRNLGWEGDTVFAQPRDVGFPSIPVLLERAQATTILLQFGRSEAMLGQTNIESFRASYRALLDLCAKQTPRLVLITPPPFEAGSGLLPDLSARNGDLAAYASAIRALAKERGLPAIDLFEELGGVKHREPRLTSDGLQLTPVGHGLAAAAFLRQLGFGEIADRAGALGGDGAWANPNFERLRQIVLQKNRWWFEYSRPQNWAFLGGDRVDQPSSHDHRDPSVRWFPAEMEQFLPLIADQERVIKELALRATR